MSTSEKKLIILRGLPGSGKSTLADAMQFEHARDFKGAAVVVSADNYFMHPCDNGTEMYLFNFKELKLAYIDCRYKCEMAMAKETSLIIVDNPNILLKHFKPYLRMAQYYRYEVEIMQVKTDWSNNPAECYKKCIHNVPYPTIQRMALQFEQFNLGD